MQVRSETSAPARTQERCVAPSTAVTRAAAVTETSATAEDTFVAMRETAMTLFKQRTKDLTKLSQMQEQRKVSEKQLAELHAVSSELQAHQAQVEASVEKGEQRAKEWTAELQTLHSTMGKLREEQHVMRKVSAATERVASITAALFQGGSEPGLAARLLQLLEAAQTRTAGRGTGEFRTLSSELRRRDAAVHAFLLEARRTGTIPKGLAVSLQEWLQGSWRHHAELAEVLTEVQRVAAVAALAATAKGHTLSSVPSPVGSPAPEALPPSGGTLHSSASAYAVVLDEDALITAGDGTTAAREQQRAVVARAVQLYLDELTSLEEEAKRVAVVCEELGVVCEVVEAGGISQLREGWATLAGHVERWLGPVVTAHADVCAALAETTAAAAHAEDRVMEITKRLAECEETMEQQALREALLQNEVDHYASAWRKLCHTATVLQSRLTELRKGTESATAKLAAVEAESHALRETVAKESEGFAAEMAELSCAAEQTGVCLESANRALAKTEATKTANENTLTQLRARIDHIEFTLVDESLTEDEVASLLAETKAVEVAIQEALGSSDAGAIQEVECEPLPTACECPSDVRAAFAHLLTCWDGADASSLEQAMRSSELSCLRLPTTVNGQPSEAIVKALQLLRTSFLEEQRCVDCHTQSMAEIAHECALIEQELR